MCTPFFTIFNVFLRSFSLFHRITERDACVCMPFFTTLFNVFLRSFPFSTGSHRETLVCACLSLRCLTFFYALFPFPQDHTERRLRVHAFLYAFQRFFTLFSLFHRITERERERRLCAHAFLYAFQRFFTLFSLFDRITEETLVCARFSLRFSTFF